MDAHPRAAPSTEPSVLAKACPRPAQLATAYILGMATALLVAHAYGSWRAGSKPSALEREASGVYRIDLNHASRDELLQLPHIGETLADRIEEYRRQHGGFRSVGELEKVPGIGPARVQELRPLVRVRAEDAERIATVGQSPTPVPVSMSGMGKAAGKKETELKEPIDINQATAADLQRLPGIGPKMSQRIIDERAKRPFKNVDELRRVSGIGVKTLEKLRPYIMVKSNSTDVASTEH